MLLKIIELIGTIAFAVSGAVTGIEKKLDLFGITFLAIVASVGGGIFRDIIIGSTPPVAFIDPTPSLVSIATALAVFLFYRRIQLFDKIIKVSDALGLGFFTAIGCRTAMSHGGAGLFLVVTMGLSTGIGGGMVRDIFVRKIPFVLRKEIYAVASLAGALSFYGLYKTFSESIALFLTSAIVFAIRIAAIIWRVNLPTSHQNPD